MTGVNAATVAATEVGDDSKVGVVVSVATDTQIVSPSWRLLQLIPGFIFRRAFKVMP